MREIPDPGFAGDPGAADALLAEALRAYADDPVGLHQDTLERLGLARLLVPVIALLADTEHDEHALAHDKSSDMAAVQLRGRDGRVALLAFTSISSMADWNPDARPVPVTAAQAAAAALDDEALALVVDVAGPVMFVVEEADLRALAARV